MLAIPPNPLFKVCEATPDTIKRQTMQNILTQSPSELSGWLFVSDIGKKTWKKVFCILRNSGFYYSSKGTSKVLIKYTFHIILLSDICLTGSSWQFNFLFQLFCAFSLVAPRPS